MKRLVFFSVLVALCSVLKAQINMNDSTVQVVAYWSLGDKYDFECRMTNYKVVGNDTTIVLKSSWPLSIEVVDSTATNYIIELRSGETQYEVIDENTKLSKESESTKVLEGIPIILKMSNYGVVEELVNEKQLLDSLSRSADIIADYALKKYEADSIFTAEGMEMMKKGMETVKKQLKSPQALSAIITPYVRMFTPFGKLYEIRKEYVGTTQMETMLAPGVPIDCTSTFWVKDVYPDEYNVVFALDLDYDSDQLMNAALSVYKDINPEIEQYANSPERPYLFISDYTGWNIHVGAGWPLYYYQEKESRQGEEATINTVEIEIIL